MVGAGILRDFGNVLANHKDRAKYITTIIDVRRQELAELITRRRQLVEMHVAESNQLEQAGKPMVEFPIIWHAKAVHMKHDHVSR